MRVMLAVAVSLLTPSLAFAHTGHGDVAGFMHGLEHPIGGLDHVFAMFAVGVLAFVLGGRALLVVPLGFVGMMLTGFILGLAQVHLPLVEGAVALSSIVIGVMAATQRRVPVAVATALVGAFAVFHGFAHGAEMPVSASGLGYALGFVISTAVLHIAGIGASMALARLSDRYRFPASRLLAAACALGGVGVLAGWF